jgi:hypothetical protein
VAVEVSLDETGHCLLRRGQMVKRHQLY